MNKNIAIITGATGGVGSEFTRQLVKESVDELWIVARNIEKLKDLKNELGEKIVIVPADLSLKEGIERIASKLEMEKPNICYLINNAGMAKMGSYQEFKINEIQDTIAVNCTAVALLSTICIPYMKRGSRIATISSAASFQPLPYLNLYAATKVFERSYTRALHFELKKTGITATAVCPGWVDTELLMREYKGEKVIFPGIISAQKMVTKAIEDIKRGKNMSVCTWYIKMEHILGKIVPQKMSMDTWFYKIKRYLV